MAEQTKTPQEVKEMFGDLGDHFKDAGGVEPTKGGAQDPSLVDAKSAEVQQLITQQVDSRKAWSKSAKITAVFRNYTNKAQFLKEDDRKKIVKDNKGVFVWAEGQAPLVVAKNPEKSYNDLLKTLSATRAEDSTLAAPKYSFGEKVYKKDGSSTYQSPSYNEQEAAIILEKLYHQKSNDVKTLADEAKFRVKLTGTDQVNFRGVILQDPQADGNAESEVVLNMNEILNTIIMKGAQYATVQGSSFQFQAQNVKAQSFYSLQNKIKRATASEAQDMLRDISKGTYKGVVNLVITEKSKLAESENVFDLYNAGEHTEESTELIWYADEAVKIKYKNPEKLNKDGLPSDATVVKSIPVAFDSLEKVKNEDTVKQFGDKINTFYESSFGAQNVTYMNADEMDVKDMTSFFTKVFRVVAENQTKEVKAADTLFDKLKGVTAGVETEEGGEEFANPAKEEKEEKPKATKKEGRK